MTKRHAPFTSFGNGLPLGSAVTLKSRFFLYSANPIASLLKRNRHHSHANCGGDQDNVRVVLATPRGFLSAVLGTLRLFAVLLRFARFHVDDRFSQLSQLLLRFGFFVQRP